jgi:O-acetyl-ADP-ribose deacetylase (regulator of RNase III)
VAGAWLNLAANWRQSESAAYLPLEGVSTPAIGRGIYRYPIEEATEVAFEMTPADISTAKNLVRECVRKNYKGC